MTFPTCYRYWIEVQLPDGGWVSDLHPERAGHDRLEQVNQVVEDLRKLGPPWTGRAFRLVTPAGRVLETLEALRPEPKAGGSR
jgi:hypothetical protein